jgi:hypothetical protein
MRKISMVLTALLILLASTFALAHGGHGHVMGTVAAAAADHLEVKTKDGKVVNVPLAKTTRFYLGKKKAGADDVQVGQKVVVHLGADGAAEQVKLPASKGMAAHTHAHASH